MKTIKRRWLLKWLLFIVTVSLVFGLMPGMIGADELSPYDMWKGEFVRGNGSTYANAGGQVILNYVKGQKSFMANVDVYGLLPNTTYYAYMLTGGGWPGGTSYNVGAFLTDDYGYGHVHENGIAPDSLNLDGTNRRFVIYRTWASPGWVLSTSLTVGDGDLQPIGSNRGE